MARAAWCLYDQAVPSETYCMACAVCGHLAEQHDDDGGCRVKILTGWDEKQAYFTGSRPCKCDAYEGIPVPVPAVNIDRGCPHEFIKGATACIHCGIMRGPS